LRVRFLSIKGSKERFQQSFSRQESARGRISLWLSQGVEIY
jgi:hypothetical protein